MFKTMAIELVSSSSQREWSAAARCLLHGRRRHVELERAEQRGQEGRRGRRLEAELPDLTTGEGAKHSCGWASASVPTHSLKRPGVSYTVETSISTPR